MSPARPVPADGGTHGAGYGAGYEAAVAGWADRLRSGDPVTWTAWLAAGPVSGPVAGAEPILATATHLELVRRLAEARPTEDFAGLADLVLGTAPVGRGRVEPRLPWPGGDRASDRLPPPEESSPGELLRVALGVLLALLPPGGPGPDEGSVDIGSSGAGVVAPRRSLFRPRFRVHGPPLAAAAVSRTLCAAGMVPGDRGATHLVIAEPIEQMMYELWTDRVAAGGVRAWRRWWRARRAVDALPPELDAPAIADRLLRTVPARRVHLLTAVDPADAALVAATALHRATSVGAPVVSRAPALTDLRRRINQVLDDPRRADVLGVWADQVALSDPGPGTGSDPGSVVGGHVLGAPPALRPWAAAQAARLRDAVASRGGDYAVHGAPETLTRALPDGVARRVAPEQTLRVALATIAGGWRDRAGTGAED